MTESSRRTATPRVSPNSILTVGLAYLVTMFEGIDLQAAGVAAPGLTAELHLSPTALGWFFASSTFGLMIGAAIGGRLSDRIGRKPVLIGSVAVFGAMALVTAYAASASELFVARLLTGLGIGGALPNVVAMVSERVDQRWKSTATGILYAGFPSGGALVSLIAAFSPAQWRVAFYVGGIAPLASIPVLVRWLPAMRADESGRDFSRLSQDVNFRFALFAECRARRSAFLFSGFFLALLAAYLILNWLPTLLVARGLSRADASFVQFWLTIGGVLASFAVGAAMDRLSRRLMVVIVFGMTAFALGILTAVPPTLPSCMAAGMCVGAGLAAMQTTIYALAPTNYPVNVRGTGMGAAVTVGRFGSALGPILAASMVSAGNSPQSVVGILVPIVMLAGTAIYLLASIISQDPDHNY